MLDDFLDIENDVAKVSELIGCNDFIDLRTSFKEKCIVTDRFNNDKNTNNNGKQLVELYQSLDLKIVNGRAGSDKGIGSMYSGKSVNDYIIVLQCLFPKIHDFNICVFDQVCRTHIVL